jgi:hypothetical protein
VFGSDIIEMVEGIDKPGEIIRWKMRARWSLRRHTSVLRIFVL